jgi:ribosomal protein S18 acetylase RimI-like enzyme
VSDLRVAGIDEVRGLWPAVRAARLFSSVDEFVSFAEKNPWRVRVSDSGESVIVAPWRKSGNLLAIRGVWAAAARIPALVEQTAVFASERGYTHMLSPLLSASAFTGYESAGMQVRERIVAVQGFAAEIAPGDPTSAVAIRSARPDDLNALVGLDAECFDRFWRYGIAELTYSLQGERMMVAFGAGGGLAGYSTCTLHGASATLGRLAVAPAARRSGVARALLAEAASWAAGQQAYALTLCTQQGNTASRRLYSAAGLFELPESYVLGIREL